MKKEQNLDKNTEQALTIPVVMQRFQDFINEYEKNIAKEKSILSELDPIESCDDILYELTIRRDSLKKCYEQVFNGA